MYRNKLSFLCYSYISIIQIKHAKKYLEHSFTTFPNKLKESVMTVGCELRGNVRLDKVN